MLPYDQLYIAFLNNSAGNHKNGKEPSEKIFQGIVKKRKRAVPVSAAETIKNRIRMARRWESGAAYIRQ